MQSARPTLRGQKPKGTWGPEEEEKKKVYEKIFEEIIVENLPNMEKESSKSKRQKESHVGYIQGETCQDTY